MSGFEHRPWPEAPPVKITDVTNPHGAAVFMVAFERPYRVRGERCRRTWLKINIQPQPIAFDFAFASLELSHP